MRLTVAIAGILISAAGACLLHAATWPAPAGQEPTLSAVLERAGAYVKGYGGQVSSLVASERYGQVSTDVVAGGGRHTTRRSILSEFALVRAADAPEQWAGFRDVVEVDGKAVQDRQDRLQRLFADPDSKALQEARKIADEGARYNIGPVARNFNVPTTALFFLHPVQQPRFKFQKLGESEVGGRSVWEVGFEERAKPTVIRTQKGKNVTARGRIWVRPEDGCIVRTEMAIENFVSGSGDSEGKVRVDYSLEPSLEMWLPVRMNETYRITRQNQLPSSATPSLPGVSSATLEPAGTAISQVLCVAQYGNYRQFVTGVRSVK